MRSLPSLAHDQALEDRHHSADCCGYSTWNGCLVNWIWVDWWVAPITDVGYVLLGVAWLDWFQHPLGSFSALVRSALGWGCLAHAQDLEAQAPSRN